MKRVNLDSADQAVKQFVSTLPVDAEGIELEFNGRVLYRLIPAGRLSQAEMKALVDERWQLIRQAQERTQGVPPHVITQEVQQAVEEVRRRHRP